MMKKIFAILTLFFAGGAFFAKDMAINSSEKKKDYKASLSVSPMNEGVTVSEKVIVFQPKKEGVEYTISGYFKGQIINKTKNTCIKLNKAYIENTKGEAAILGEAKTEISSFAGTENYVISSGKNSKKTAAIQCRKNLELGGSGTIYVLGNVYHAVKADDVKLKGSGTYYLQGTKEGSGINCENLISEKDKTFKAYLLNSKNGAKADFKISLSSGNFFFYNNKTALKTDTKKEDPKNPHGITLSDCTIRLSGNETFYKTEENAFKEKNVKIIEE